VSVAPGETGSSYPYHLRDLLDRYLEELDLGVSGVRDRLVGAMRHSLLAGGKRIRPVLTLAVAEGRGCQPASVLPTAAACELIHTYSLIHDDLPAIDDDDLRRGRPTCHVAFGEDVAILAGDGLYAEAVALILERQAAEPAVKVAVLTEFALATGLRGMVGGQFMDVVADRVGGVDLETMHTLKTGRLIEAAVTSGALLTAASPDEVEAYRRFASELGLLFQIVDDVLDVVGDRTTLGKTAGKDAAADKLTYVSMYGLEGARRRADDAHRRARELAVSLPGDPGDLLAVTDYIATRDR
jgi:geranylgeranyl diphosphate synthase type II